MAGCVRIGYPSVSMRLSVVRGEANFDASLRELYLNSSTMGVDSLCTAVKVKLRGVSSTEQDS